MALPSSLGLAPLRLYAVPKTSYAEQLCESIIAEVLNRDEGCLPMIDSLHVRYLVVSRRMISGERSGRGTAVKRIVHWINGNFGGEIDADILVSMSGLNRTDFFRDFRRETGMTPLAYVADMRLRSAQLLLCTTAMRHARSPRCFASATSTTSPGPSGKNMG
jgi:AraC-like DNA-binding protein